MFAQELYKCPLLTDNFGESKTYQFAQELRDLGMLPKYNWEHLTTTHIGLMIYCLSVCEKKKDVAKYARMYGELISIDGPLLTNVIDNILADDKKLAYVKAIHFFRGTGLVIMEFSPTDDLPGGSVAPFNVAESNNDLYSGVKVLTTIYPDWLRDLKEFATKANTQFIVNEAMKATGQLN